MQRTNEKLVSAAQYAEMRGLNRSTISRQIRDGSIPTVGGKVDPRAADQARKDNLDSTRVEQAQHRKAELSTKKQARALRPAQFAPAPGAGYVGDARGLALRELFERLISQSGRIPGILCEAGCRDPVALAVAPEVFLDFVFAFGYDLASEAYNWCGNDDRSPTPVVDMKRLARKYRFKFDPKDVGLNFKAGDQESKAEALVERFNGPLGF